MKKYLTIDVGGSSIKYAVIDDELNFILKGKVINNFENLNNYTDAIKKIYEENGQECEGLACSMPGVIDSSCGYFYSGGAYDEYIHGINLVDELHKKIDCKISIANDAKCAASAELGYGVLKDVDSAIVIVLGTAIGGCVILNHKVVNGKHFSAGEFSAINCDLINSNFTGKGDIWALRNGSIGLLNRVNEELGEKTTMDGVEIFDRINKGDEKVYMGLKKFCKELAGQIENFQIIFDPEKIAIGGGISSQPLLLEMLNDELDKIHEEVNIICKIERPTIVTCKYFNDANLIGAMYHFKELFEK